MKALTPKRRRNLGVTFIELMAAVLILGIVAAGGVATWSLTSRIPETNRLTAMGSLLATREIERLKVQGYDNLADGTVVTYYDKYGASTSVAANEVYRVSSTVATTLNRDGATNVEDLREIVVSVTNVAGTTTYETQRTLLTFGGA